MGETDQRARDAAATVRDLAQRIEEAIVLGALHPRERLVEDELMARYLVKRHVVRQALSDLEKQGLVQRKRNSGAQVKALTAKEVSDLYALRDILESSCARLIPFPVEDQQIEHLVVLQKEHAAAINHGDARAVFRANLAFHAAVYALSGNNALIEAVAEYARRTYPVRISTLVSKEHLERARDDHEKIIEALRRGERKQLVELCSKHLRPSRETYLNNLKRFGRDV